MKRILLTLALVALTALPAFAGKYDFVFPSDLSNDVFKEVVKEAGTLTAYRSLSPAEAGGITGFDVGITTSTIKIDSDEWDEVLEGNAPSYLVVPKLQLRKGLPFGVDVGASYTVVPSSDIRVIGGELQYAFVEGSTVMPALALRGHYSKIVGVEDLDLENYGGDLVLSKGILMATPYVGIGVNETKGAYSGDDTTLQSTLKDQTATDTRVFGGVQFAVALLRITLDAEFANIPVYSAKLSLGW